MTWHIFIHFAWCSYFPPVVFHVHLQVANSIHHTTGFKSLNAIFVGSSPMSASVRTNHQSIAKYTEQNFVCNWWDSFLSLVPAARRKCLRLFSHYVYHIFCDKLNILLSELIFILYFRYFLFYLFTKYQVLIIINKMSLSTETQEKPETEHDVLQSEFIIHDVNFPYLASLTRQTDGTVWLRRGCTIASRQIGIASI